MLHITLYETKTNNQSKFVMDKSICSTTQMNQMNTIEIRCIGLIGYDGEWRGWKYIILVRRPQSS